MPVMQSRASAGSHAVCEPKLTVIPGSARWAALRCGRYGLRGVVNRDRGRHTKTIRSAKNGAIVGPRDEVATHREDHSVRLGDGREHVFQGARRGIQNSSASVLITQSAPYSVAARRAISCPPRSVTHLAVHRDAQAGRHLGRSDSRISVVPSRRLMVGGDDEVDAGIQMVRRAVRRRCRPRRERPRSGRASPRGVLRESAVIEAARHGAGCRPSTLTRAQASASSNTAGSDMSELGSIGATVRRERRRSPGAARTCRGDARPTRATLRSVPVDGGVVQSDPIPHCVWAPLASDAAAREPRSARRLCSQPVHVFRYLRHDCARDRNGKCSTSSGYHVRSTASSSPKTWCPPPFCISTRGLPRCATFTTSRNGRGRIVDRSCERQPSRHLLDEPSVVVQRRDEVVLEPVDDAVTVRYRPQRLFQRIEPRGHQNSSASLLITQSAACSLEREARHARLP